MNFVNVIVFYFCLAVTRCSLWSDYLLQLQKKPKYKNVVHLDSEESRRDIHSYGVPRWPMNPQRLVGINPGHKVMKSSINKYFRRPVQRSQKKTGVWSKLRDISQKKNIRTNMKKQLRLPAAAPNTDPHIPMVGGLHPGHTLLLPKGMTLKSAAKYPKDNTDHLVYGNPRHFGITYNKTRDRVLYSDFRRMNNDNDDHVVENTVLQAILSLKYYQEQAGRKSDGVIVIGIEPKSKNVIEDTSNEAAEVMDLRRSKRYKNHQKIDRESKYKRDSSSGSTSNSTSSESKDFDKNPGNPYTLHKNRYHQNYQWNHFMTGDHMNIDPYGPKTYAAGPTAQDLFFGRKWWYFNQDDYKPLG